VGNSGTADVASLRASGCSQVGAAFQPAVIRRGPILFFRVRDSDSGTCGIRLNSFLELGVQAGARRNEDIGSGTGCALVSRGGPCAFLLLRIAWTSAPKALSRLDDSTRPANVRNLVLDDPHRRSSTANARAPEMHNRRKGNMRVDRAGSSRLDTKGRTPQPHRESLSRPRSRVSFLPGRSPAYLVTPFGVCLAHRNVPFWPIVV
jgi:hypothetical protein